MQRLAFPCIVSGHEGQGVSVGCVVAGTGVMPVTEEQHGGFVDLTAPGVEFAVWVALGAAVFCAGGAELAEGDGEAAGLGEEVAAVAEAVRPLVVAERPGGFDEPAVVGRAAERLDLERGAEPVGGQARGIGGLGGVLGDVVGDRRCG